MTVKDNRRRRGGAWRIAAVLACVAGAGCVGYREHWDPAADRYERALEKARPFLSERGGSESLPTSADVDLVHAALDRGLLTVERAAHCMEVQRYKARAGNRAPLERLLLETGDLTRRQLAEIRKDLARTARCTVNVTRTLNGQLATPVSTPWPEFEELARQTVRDTVVLRDENIRESIDRPDYHFVFNITIDTTAEPGLCSGLILPFYRSRGVKATLQVLDERGDEFAHYAASAGTYQYRHVLFVLFTPFYWPGWADARAERNLFEALTVKLLTDRAEFH